MTTLLSVHKTTESGGKCVGRCDANCYNAVTPKCTCICGGRNHGRGLNSAIVRTARYLDQYLEHTRTLEGTFTSVHKPVLEARQLKFPFAQPGGETPCHDGPTNRRPEEKSTPSASSERPRHAL